MLVLQTLEIIIGTICGTVLAQNTAKLVGTKSLVGLKALLTKGCGRGEIGKHKGLKRLSNECRPTAASLIPSFKTITCLTLNLSCLGYVFTTVPVSCQKQR